MHNKSFTIDEYTPCRITELYLDLNEEIEITTIKGVFRIKGVARKIWLMLDGKHTISSIVNQLCLEYNVEKDRMDEVKNRVTSTLKSLREKEAIIVNWDPLFKFSISQELE